MAFSAVRATATVFCLFAAGVIGGAWAGSAAVERARDPYVPLDTLVRVLGMIEATYVDEIPTEDLVGHAINGMLESLDDHSTWMSPTEYRDLQRDHQTGFTGIGVEVEQTPQGVRVIEVLPGSPAERDGVLVGDQIVNVDGQDLQDASADKITEALTGPRGEETRLKLRRADNVHEVATIHDLIHPPSVSMARVDDDIVYVRVVQFREGATNEATAAIRRATEVGPMRGLLLDLRNNPGGLLREAVALTDLFLDEGVIVSTWGRLESEQAEHLATPGGIDADVPVVVLVNGRSASASEIVASALQDTGRATLVGTRTYGKGSVQTVFEHRDGSALKLTIGRYYTPSGDPVAPRHGRTPDMIVPWPAPESPLGRMRQAVERVPMSDASRSELLAVLENMPEELVVHSHAIPWSAPLSDRLQRDPQLAAGVQELRRQVDDTP